ncbi:hypothetical protein ACQPW3_41460 [Actinosynnema sp. CA-248983]
MRAEQGGHDNSRNDRPKCRVLPTVSIAVLGAVLAPLEAPLWVWE